MTTNTQTLQQPTAHSIDGFTTINELGNLSGSFLKNLSWSFRKQGPYREILDNEINFSGKQFYFYGDDVVLFKYSSLEELNKDKANWEKRFKKINAITSETIDGKQVIEPSGFFEFEGNFYLLGLLYQDLDMGDNDEDNGIYNGVIVNHSKYFIVDEKTHSISERIKGNL